MSHSQSQSQSQAGASASYRDPKLETPVGIVAPGDVIGGKFRVERVLGSGGMGIVVEARHIELDDRVAVKLLLPAALEQTDLVARFKREARAAVKIKSEHIARVIDVGSLEDGAPFMVMEYLEGNDLSKLIKDGARIPVVVAVDYMLQAMEALAEAHAIGIVHRDLKPQNLFLTHRSDGSACIKVLDFGISKVVGASEDSEAATEMTLTHTTLVLGSPRYMAPEQMSKPKSVDHRADIWAMGSTFYRLVTGRAPYQGSTLPEIFAAILMDVEGPPPIHEFCPDAPPELDGVIRRCMQRKPEDRWQNISDFALALAPFGSPAAAISAARVRGTLESAGVRTSLPPASGPGQPVRFSSSVSNSVSASQSIAPASQSRTGAQDAWVQTGPGQASPRNPLPYFLGGVFLVLVGAGIALYVVSLGRTTVATTPSVQVIAPIAPAAATVAPATSTAPTPPPLVAPPMAQSSTVEQATLPSSPAKIKPAIPSKSAPAPSPPTTKKKGGEDLFDERN